MGLSPFVTRRIAEDRMKDIQREVEQIRLIHAVKGSSGNATAQWIVALFAVSIVAVIAIVLQIA